MYLVVTGTYGTGGGGQCENTRIFIEKLVSLESAGQWYNHAYV
jgi:hypothetical protein